MSNNQELILRLLECNVLKTGEFTLKSGVVSPIYIDLRRIISYPNVLKDLACAVRDRQVKENLQTDGVCGVPYTAIPIASVFSALYNIPMIMKKKEKKDYGTKKIVEGVFKTGDSCLLIEDIVCTGTSIMETSEALRNEGLNVRDCIVIVNRDQGGVENLKKIGITLYPLFHVSSVFNAFCSINRIEAELVQKITAYFKDNSYLPMFEDKTCRLSYSERAKIMSHPVAKRLLEIMDEKKTNLCVAVDTNNCDEIIKITKQLGPHICLLKTHIDILDDFSENVITELTGLASEHRFLLMEDRKFADIGNTVTHQYKNGMYRIEAWADIVTVHGIAGSGTIEALKSYTKKDKRACALIAEMSTDGALTSDDYKEGIFQIANAHEDFVIGYVAQKIHPKGKKLICMCPGINLSTSKDSLNQVYNLPEDAVANGADIIIVGRGVLSATNIVATAIEYKTRGYNAYLKHISQKK